MEDARVREIVAARSLPDPGRGHARAFPSVGGGPGEAFVECSYDSH